MASNDILLHEWLQGHLKTRGAISDVCQATGLARTTIYRLLSGKTEPDAKTLALIANALGAPVPTVEKVLIVREPEVEETAATLIESAQLLLGRAIRNLKSQSDLEAKKPVGSPHGEIRKGKKRRTKD
jgi:transcriptional regulator with XRE-family HTH domain